jgi:enterochelin esterase-like enzyme
VQALVLPTTYLDKPLQANVYLPPCYAAHPAERYPVLYLFHGQGSTDDQWIRLGATTAADRLIASGQVPPFIIVMPYDPLWREPDQYGFEDAVIQDLLPAIDSRFRTLPGPTHRAVGGLSRGSGWAFHLGLSRPDLFGAIGAHSVVLFGEDSRRLDDWLAAIPPASMPRIYLDIGDYDGGLASARILEGLLTADGIPHEWHLNLGSHNESYWSAHVEEYLRWYAAGW